MPANIIYCSVMTPEFITIFFASLGVLLIVNGSEQKSNVKKAILFLLAGICIGIGSAYKSFGIIILIAMVMCFIANNIIERGGWKSFLIVVAAVALVFGGYKLSKALIQSHSEEVMGIELDESRSIPHFLLIGLNTEGEGQIHIGTMSRFYYLTYLENGMDAEAAREKTYELLRMDWSVNGRKIPNLIAQKMIWAWQDDTVPVNYFDIATGNNKDLTWIGIPVVTLTQVFYMIVLIGALIGCIADWRDICWKKEFLLLIIFGYTCLIIISEAQSRYKCLIMPFMCVISGIGLEKLLCKKVVPAPMWKSDK